MFFVILFASLNFKSEKFLQRDSVLTQLYVVSEPLGFFFFNFVRFGVLVSRILICLPSYQLCSHCFFCLNCSRISSIVVLQVTGSDILIFARYLLIAC